jgi:hypothetical protein
MVYRIDSQAFDAPVNGCAIARSDLAKLDWMNILVRRQFLRQVELGKVDSPDRW